MKVISGERIKAGDLVYFMEREGELYAYKFHAEGDTTTVDPEAPAAPTAEPTPKPPEEQETEAQKRGDEEPRPTTGGAKPPKDGPCRNCKRMRPLNRFKLCYACWVEAEIIEVEKARGNEWKPGDAHPKWCHCEGLGEHPERDNGAWRGN